ncbi:MAG: phosphoribosylanthranilate isomerase [Thiotrichaceae bacterium]|nr:phosphoribosylanthranilate isomerase [Thiotrichaceae bacterium]
MRTRVKICGITRPEDAIDAAYLGADAIGLVFYAKSPRAVNIEQAQSIIQALPAFVTSVGLFVDADVNEVKNILNHVPLDLLQFHGDESPEYCTQFSRPYIKALRVHESSNVEAFAQQHYQAQAILLDTYVKGVKGGTGQAFNWQLVPEQCSQPLIIAGGLTPANLPQVIQQLNPYAVDVSGGVEQAKGIKDKAKVTAFIKGSQL